MNAFENRMINGYIYETRFIASWLKAGGTFSTRNDIKHFCEWLKMSLGLDEEDISHIRYLATNGKYELECSAEDYLKNVPEKTEDED